ncbi:MAG: hypothetical protein QOK05_2908 [Chloroflexota bacterium]|jgi:3-hydroxyisobutyrate dehydrogenase-like beta-hydroxyacid dehydrogenase|nr:hypothetical protein [Chloroflexota bacterium]
MDLRGNKGSGDLPRVAVLGTGKMGGAMARRLSAEGFPVTVWNRTQAKAEALGVGSVATSPAQAARDADVIISMVTGPQAIRDIYLDRGVLAAAAGKTIVEMSTAGPGATAMLADAAAERGVTMVDAPVMGSVAAVLAGTLAILASAEDEAEVDAIRPVLEHLGEVRYVGRLGTSASLKLVANSFLAIVSTAAAELMAAGARQGVEADEMFNILTRTAPGLRVREAGFVRHQHQPAMFNTSDIVKDLDLAMRLFTEGGAPIRNIPLTVLVHDQYMRVADASPNDDITAITNAYSIDRAPAAQIKEVA